MRSRLTIALCCLIATGCDDAQPDRGEGSAQSLVSNFAMPDFKGLAVRDHENGVEVVTTPQWYAETYPPGTIITHVHCLRVRNAEEFRELANLVYERGEVPSGIGGGIRLDYTYRNHRVEQPCEGVPDALR